ncbi:MAG: hypothetical protein L3J39_17425 [Verrucomicrobiales bacterium]|nr:hypothetical protein [Verrucomicrobiales bacterium]
MNKLFTSILMAFLAVFFLNRLRGKHVIFMLLLLSPLMALFLFLGIKAAEAKENPNRLNEIRAAHAAIKHQNEKKPSFFLEAKLALLKIEAIAAK